VITAYPIDDDGGLAVDQGRVIVHSDHPSSIQHHGGSLAFDGDGNLYFGFGDGGGLGDPRENGQRLSTLLGKVNRVRPTPDGKAPYEIPEDNPFADGGPEGARPEIWVYGARNPFRLSYDAGDDSIWLGDVGQSCWEEIDHLPVSTAGGGNLGWDVQEGTHHFEDGPLPTPVIDPVFEVSHRRGWCAIVVGPVQRGDAVPSLDGRLLVSDYCTGYVWSFDPAHPTDVIALGLHAPTTIAIVPGPEGRPWVLTLDGDVLEIRDDEG
jgi:glucose/arabinose dehydrogenase